MPFVIPVFIPHLGCPHDCLFCNQQKISGEKKGTVGATQIKDAIDLWLSRKKEPGAAQVAFYGGSFTCLDSDVQELLLGAVQPFIESGAVSSIRCSTRPDCISVEVCATLVKHRVSTVELGVQSLNDQVLKISKRGHNAAQCYRAIGLLQDAGLTSGVQLMPGLPGDNTCSFFRTVNEVVEMQPDFVRLYPAVVVKDSGLESLYRNGDYRPLNLVRAVAIVAKSYQIFSLAGIKVVRMGLQPSESLGKNVVAGPYHPSFGQLVFSHLWFKNIRHRLSRLKENESLEITISHRDVSTLVGNKKCNVKRLDALGFSDRYKITTDRALAKGKVNYVVSE